MDRCDGILMELLQEKKTIVNFLDTVFGFLARRTDFYQIMHKEGDIIGFPPGAKENIVLCALKKYDKYCWLAHSAEKTLLSTHKSEEQAPPIDTHKLLQKNKTEEVSSFRKPKEKFQDNDYYNGGCFENYCWNQTISDLEFHMILPKSITTPKELNVKIDKDYLKITQKLHPESALLEGKLLKKCKNVDAVWSISEGKLQISMDKIQEVWWDRFFESESPLDLSKIDCSRPMEELPEESQEVIKKLRFDQQQQLLGQPTSEQIRNTEILRAAWDAEGSPFKGQPFDPSLVHFN